METEGSPIGQDSVEEPVTYAMVKPAKVKESLINKGMGHKLLAVKEKDDGRISQTWIRYTNRPIAKRRRVYTDVHQANWKDQVNPIPPIQLFCFDL
ncbi:hypothetical protein SNEBB_006770 [Seison nebaliae]|nr:hypothetical protein SNEBB_006770 [Seison nebaliae]